MMPKHKITIYKDMKQRTDEWYTEKVAKVGGSSSHRLLTDAKMDTLVYDLVEEKITNRLKDVFVNDAMKHGTDTEDEACTIYELENATQVTNVGLIKNSGYKHAVLSPDGLVGKTGGLEIKCPTTSTHLKILITKKIKQEWLAQISWYFIINENLDWVDFISYDYRVDVAPYYEKRFFRTSEEIEPLIKKLKEQYKKFEQKFEQALKTFQ